MTRSKLLRSTTLCGALLLAIYAPQAVQAEETTPAADPAVQDQAQPAQQKKKEDDKKNQLDAVVVTGSRIKRAEAEGPAPVTVLTGEQMKKQGFTTVYEAVRSLTEAIGNVQNDYDWGQSAVNGKPLNLRNLGPGRSLLLINGHRVADYPLPYQGKSNFSNYNNIPTGIVERIEVLTGSASAIYGSDAMAGVVNVILKKNISGHTLRAKWGEATPRGGRRNLDLEASGGFSGNKWNLLYDAQHYTRGVLLARERPWMDSEDDKDYRTWNPGERHFGHAALIPYPGLYLRDRDTPNPTGRTYIAPPAGACEQYGDLYYRANRLAYNRNTGAEANGGQYCAQRVFGNWALRTGTKNDSIYLRGTYDFNDNLEGWAALGYWKTTGSFNSFLNAFASGPYFDPRANNGAGGNRNFLKFLSPGEVGGDKGILTLSREVSIDFSAGIKGRLADRYDWELSAGRATYTNKENYPTLNQGQMFNYFMGPQLGTAANGNPIYTPDYNKLWNPVPASDTAPFSKRGENHARSWLNQAQFVVSGDLFKGWAGPIGAAATLDYGKQGYSLTPDPKVLKQDADAWETPFGNVMQGGGTRSHYGAGVEFKVPVLKTVTVDLAGRYDKYQAVRNGAKPTYQFGLEWRPVNSLLLRATYGTSFRAPDMHFIYRKPGTDLRSLTDYDWCAAIGGQRPCGFEEYKASNVVIERNGAPNLNYETGKSLSYGFVWDAFKNFSVSADMWDAKIKNLIDDIDEGRLLRDDAACRYNGWTTDGSTLAAQPSASYCSDVASRIIRSQVRPGPTGNPLGDITKIVVNPINRADTHVRGLDMNIRYSLPKTPIGRFDFNAGYTNQIVYENRQFPTDELQNTRAWQLTYKLTTTVNWNWQKWNATLAMFQKAGGRDNRYGGCMPFADGFIPSRGTYCQDLSSTSSPTYGQWTAIHKEHRPARRYFNGSLGYQFNDNLKFNLYGANLLNKIYRDKWCADFAYCVDDPVGRELSAEVVYHF